MSHSQGVLAPDYELHADTKLKVRYAVPAGTDIDVYRKAIEDLPAQEGPDLFGLNPNADLTFRSLQARPAHQMTSASTSTSVSAMQCGMH